MWKIIKRFWQLTVSDVHYNVLGVLEASYSYLTNLSGHEGNPVIKVMATVTRFPGLFSLCCFPGYQRQIENITHVSHVL